MGREIERKFLVRGEGWRGDVLGSARIEQGYLSADPERVVRVRIQEGRAMLTVKGRGQGASRPEYEYPIPLADARELLALCLRPPIVKTRHRVEYQGAGFEIDVFEAENAPLVLAELELAREDQPVPRPPWLGEEVTEDPRYTNAHLALHPYRGGR